MINHVFFQCFFSEEKRKETSGTRLKEYDIFNISFFYFFFKTKVDRKEAIFS